MNKSDDVVLTSTGSLQNIDPRPLPNCEVKYITGTRVTNQVEAQGLKVVNSNPLYIIGTELSVI